MKNTFRWMFAAILLCGLTISSCKKNPEPTPEPEPETVTRLSTEKTVKVTTALTLNVSRTFTWENGILMQLFDTLIAMPLNIQQFYQNNMIYENGNLTGIDEENDYYQFGFTYEDGLLKTFVSAMDNDTSSWGEVTAYTEDGNVREYMDYNAYRVSRWTITWADGDVIEEKEEVLEPEELVTTRVYTYTYDNHPNRYTGIPLAWAIKDGDGIAVARFMSKHNQIEDGYTYNYDENGLLISIVAENDSIFYNYIEQTLK